MSKQNIDWSNLGFGYIKTDYRYVCRYKDGQWDEGGLETDANITLNECACVFQYCQACFEGMKAYYTKDGHIVCFRPDMNAKRMADSAARLEMPPFPVDKFVDAVKQVVAANADFVPPYGTGASLYIRPFVFANDVGLGVHASKHEYLRASGAVLDHPEGRGNAVLLRLRREVYCDRFAGLSPGAAHKQRSRGNHRRRTEKIAYPFHHSASESLLKQSSQASSSEP